MINDSTTENKRTRLTAPATPVTPPTGDSPDACPHCHGAGKLREWSTFMAILATVGFGGGGYIIYQHYVDGPFAGSLRLPLIFFFGLGIIGLYALVDRGECKACDGMGRIEPDDDR